MNIEPSDLVIPGVIFSGLALLFVASGFARERLRRKYGKKADLWFGKLHAPVECLLAVSAIYAALRSLDLRWTRDLLFRQLYAVALIALFAWLAIRGIALGFALAQRRPQGRLGTLRLLGLIFIDLVALSCLLLTFDNVRLAGFGLLIMTGLITLIILTSGRGTLGAAIAGLGLALSQAIRPGDEVIVDGRPGRIESIHLTYAVMALPEGGRLILPIFALTDRPVEILSRPQPARS